MSLTDKDLKEDLGVNVLGHRKHILKQIDMYKVILIVYRLALLHSFSLEQT